MKYLLTIVALNDDFSQFKEIKLETTNMIHLATQVGLKLLELEREINEKYLEEFRRSVVDDDIPF